MIDFSTLQDLTIPEGRVAEIRTADGRVLWIATKPVTLEVAKITDDTYAGATTYTGEQFVCLDIYPKYSNSSVRVTYGGLTKLITFSGTNSQQVFFGTMYGQSDTVATPMSGTLKIEGGFIAFSVGTYTVEGNYKTLTSYCNCVTAVHDMGGIIYIPSYAFYKCSSLPSIDIPDLVTSIGSYAFYGCENLVSINLSDSVTSIGESAFEDCHNLTMDSLPNGLTIISKNTFNNCPKVCITEIPEGVVDIEEYAFSVETRESSTYDGGVYDAIILPKSLQKIGRDAFVYDRNTSTNTTHYSRVRKVTILATTPPEMPFTQASDYSPAWGAFGSDYGLDSITVPKGCSDAYKVADGWSLYADKIVEAS